MYDLFYSVSGIAVNHRHHWDPNYSVTEIPAKVNSDDLSKLNSDENIIKILDKLNIKDEFVKFEEKEVNLINIVLKRGNVTINKNTGIGTHYIKNNRFLLRALNNLHKNLPQNALTIIADIFAIAMMILAFTGLFKIKGRTKIRKRSATLTTIGILLTTVVALILL